MYTFKQFKPIRENYLSKDGKNLSKSFGTDVENGIMSVVDESSEKMGLMDTNTNELILDPIYNGIHYNDVKKFGNIVRIVLDKKWGLVDWNTGEVIKEPYYDFIGDP